MVRVFVINTHEDLTKCALIDHPHDFEPISELFSHRGEIVALSITDGVLVLPPDSSNGVDPIILIKFHLLKICELVSKET